MIACSFDESNIVLHPPEGMTPEQCEVLSVFRGTQNDSGAPFVISCWKMTQDEVEEFKKTGRIWLLVLGDTMPPVALQAIKPEMTTT